MRIFRLLLIIFLSSAYPVNAQTKKTLPEDSDFLTRADLNFFFKSIKFFNGEWVFQFSPNTNGMLWRIRDHDLDLTGACISDEVRTVPALASFEIKRQDLRLLLVSRYRQKGILEARLTLNAEKGLSETAERGAWIIPSSPSNDGIRLVQPKD